jgi:[ribosomal protein S18]-alanine N-acetyltransferase
MQEVLEIEQHSFEYPWSPNDFTCCTMRCNCIGMISEYECRIVGFMIYELRKTHIHLLNFAVHERFRRIGVGTQMINILTSKLGTQNRSGRNKILLELRETNLDAQIFFRRMNFRVISTLKSFYNETAEDAYLMQYKRQNQPHGLLTSGFGRFLKEYNT